VPRCLIERTLTDPAGTLDRAKREAVKFGSIFRGDTERGDYILRTPLGSVEGTYTVSGSMVSFAVEKKPMVVPCALIEKILDEFLK